MMNSPCAAINHEDADITCPRKWLWMHCLTPVLTKENDICNCQTLSGMKQISNACFLMAHCHIPFSAWIDSDSYFWYIHCGASGAATTVETSSSYFNQSL